MQNTRLTPRQIAEAAALADVGAVLCLVAQIFPIAGGAAFAACLPFAVVGLRHTARTVVVAIFAGAVMAFVLGGTATVTMTVAAALVGTLVGVSVRRRWSVLGTLAAAIPLLALPVAVVALAFMTVLPGLRDLAFKMTRATWTGVARLLSAAGLGRPADAATRMLDWSISHWVVAVPGLILVGVLVGVWLVRASMGPPLVQALQILPRDSATVPTAELDGATPGPVPVSLRDVRVRFGKHTALAVERFALAPGELVSVVGANGAGKSTLARVVAGVPPTDGTVVRPGAAGLGHEGGTAIVFQRPESQVLGVRVADDVRFGRELREDLDVDGVLARVGLAGMGDRETSTLSGGQLQRLAIASALAREPALLISDESTAMLDTRGRADVIDLYRRVAQGGTSVLHVTHHEAEARLSDRTVTVERPGTARALETVPPRRSGPLHPAPHTPSGSVPGRPRDRPGTVAAVGLRYVRDAGTPWDHPVLDGVNLLVPGGTAMAVTGANGAGKSTLAWLLAGLLTPDAGTVTVDGEPVIGGRGHVLIGVQHARLQVLRATVGRDVADASGALEHEVRRALATVGLDPDVYSGRRADELSGGEQRRVVLAGLLAARPRVLILDEPLAGLDEAATAAMRDALAAVKARGTTLIVVTHDLPALGGLVDGSVEVHPTDAVPEPHRPRRRRPDLSTVLGRPLPGPTPAHRLWVGTKLGALTAMGVVVGVWTNWWVLGASAMLLAGWFVLAGSPWRAVPKMPRLFWVFAVVSLVITGIGSGKTSATVLGTTISVSGVDAFARGLVATLLSLAAALLFCWTTPLGRLPAFLQECLDRFGRLGRRGLAAATSVALAVRLGPLVLSEVQTMWRLAVQRRPVTRSGRRKMIGLEDLFEMLTLTTVQACRRAGEMADAIASRGGLGAVAQPARGPTRLDLAAALGAVLVLAAGVVAGLFLPGMVD
ncbi:DUF2232 domain-containing protein [Tsukamurella sp. 8F]|uniref:DUF2232 domain-containing protein n=1 Tax=unclassified Tsukamurella TaxID=2633480 RepID=UPI0023BA1BA7|nr:MULTISPECIES: DUF2232 domain-containing protein [unclassified Tsukamurella]MDF0528633.1 DUF2232 domain-containing protein [Tsukamurella sp. 8J]MDF0585595.1 DUF2232 domain-containing protein [Tsukamurella sp. 8F]